MQDKTGNEFIEVSFLEDFPKLKDALLSIVPISKSKIKNKEKIYPILNKKVYKNQTYLCPLELVNVNKINPEYSGPEIKILYDDNRIMALHKPPQVHCHPLNYLDKNNCLSFLRSINKKDILQVNLSKHERGLLFRLDYETSGVLVAIKNEEDYRFLRDNFSTQVEKKIYLAIVNGDFSYNGEIKNYLIPSGPKGGKIKIQREGSHEHLACLNVHKLNYCAEKNKSLLKIELQTGMRHQIRAQLSALDFPICGDVLYGGENVKSERLFLHAYQYSLSLPENQFGPKKHYDFFDEEWDLFNTSFLNLKSFL